MHILFLSDNFPPESNAPASRTHEHTKRWVAAGHRVSVVTTAPNFPTGRLFGQYRNRLWQRETIDGVEVIRLWTFITANEGFALRTLDYLSFLMALMLATPWLPRADIVVATSPQFFTTCAGFWVARLKGVPWVFELRDMWPESIVALGAMRESILVRTLRRLEYFLYRKATLIVSVTHSFRTVLSGNGISREKIHVVPNGADLSLFAPGGRSPALAERLGLSGKFVAAYVGTVGMAHGLDVILNAAERLRGRTDIVFLIVGTGAHENEIRARAAKRQLANVCFTGLVTKAEVADYWRLSDVGLVLLRDLPVFRHVLPSKMFEAWASERPIILGVAGESADVLRQANAGISIAPEDDAALADAVVDLAAHEDERLLMGRSGRSFVVANYSRDALAAQMLDLLTAAAATPRA